MKYPFSSFFFPLAMNTKKTISEANLPYSSVNHLRQFPRENSNVKTMLFIDTLQNLCLTQFSKDVGETILQEP